MERHRREEEIFRKEEPSRRQMELLQSLVDGVHLQGVAATRRAESDKDVRVPKLTEKDDIVSYLTMFERLMVAYERGEVGLQTGSSLDWQGSGDICSTFCGGFTKL